MIPKVIHYCWFGGNKLPKSVKKNIESWKKYCPDYKIVRWDESNFDVNSNEFVREAYAAKAWAFVSDYVRLKVVYDNGGVYLDTDVELIKNLDHLLNDNSYFFEHQGVHLVNTGLGFGAVKGSEAVNCMLGEYNNLNFSLDKKEELACPRLNTRALKKIGFKYSNKILRNEWGVVYPPKYADPYTLGQSENLRCAETVSIHHYDASWTGIINRVKLKLYRKIGMDKIIQIKKLLNR